MGSELSVAANRQRDGARFHDSAKNAWMLSRERQGQLGDGRVTEVRDPAEFVCDTL